MNKEKTAMQMLIEEMNWNIDDAAHESSRYLIGARFYKSGKEYYQSKYGGEDVDR